VWVWKLTNNKDGRTVSPTTDSRTVPAQMYWHIGTFEYLLDVKQETYCRTYNLKTSKWVEKSSILKNFTTNFLGHQEAENYCDMVGWSSKIHKANGCNMSLMVHFLNSHLDFFPRNLRAVSDGMDSEAISPENVLHGKTVQMQVESQYAGWLLPNT